MSILAAEGLVKTYQRRRVVDGVDLHVEAGEIAGLLGPNGAGKSTCFKMMCGLVRPDKGRVFLLNHEVTRLPLFQRSRLGMGYLPQQSSLFNKLTVQANLLGMMQLLGYGRKERKQRCEYLLEQFNIKHVRKSKAETLSGGERRRLEIARCLVSDPKIIMLDEPFAAIDPVTVQNIQQVIRELAEQGIAILITDHAAREILQITDRTYVVSDGRILCSGSADEITSHPEVKQKYLGELDWIGSSERNSAEAAAAKKKSAQMSGSTRTADNYQYRSAKPVSHQIPNHVTIETFPQRVESPHLLGKRHDHRLDQTRSLTQNRSIETVNDRSNHDAADATISDSTDNVIQPRRSRIVFSDKRKFRSEP